MSDSNKRKMDLEHQEFEDRWVKDYFFVLNENGLPQCLVCFKIVDKCEEFNLKRHYLSKHEEVYRSFSGDMKRKLVEHLKKELHTLTYCAAKGTNLDEASALASLEVCLELVKVKKPFFDGELVKKCAMKMAEAFNNYEMVRKFQAISLSRKTVIRQIKETSMYVNNKLKNLINNCSYFSVALDESPGISEKSHLLIFIRTVNENFEYSEEFFKLKPLRRARKIDDVYEQLMCAVKECGGFDKCTAIMTNGAVAMTDKNVGLTTRLPKEGIKCLVSHSIIHQDVLFGVSLQLKDVMDKVCKITNLIYCANRSLTGHNFEAFLDELENKYGNLLLRNGIHWLSAGRCLTRFFIFREKIYQFLTKLGVDKNLTENLVDENFLCSLAFLADMTDYLNILNDNLQEQDQNAYLFYKYVTGFRNKLKLLRHDLEENNLFHFGCCRELYEEMKKSNVEVNFKIFLPKLDILIAEFDERFYQFDAFKPKFDLFCDPIHVDVNSVGLTYQMELCNLQADLLFKSHRLSGLEIFKSLNKEQYPKLRDFGLQVMSMFGCMHICERAYSNMEHVRSNYGKGFKGPFVEDIIRLATTNIDVDLRDIVAKQFETLCLD